MEHEHKNTQEVLLQGLVQPWGWDSENRVTNVLLSCHGEQDFYIVPDGLGRQLAAWCGRFVEIRGQLCTSRGVTTLRIISFREKPAG